MKNNLLLLVLSASIIVFAPAVNYGQMPNYGAAANFVFFTTTGAITANNSVSHITGGDMGTNSGQVTGFDNTSMSGRMHIGDALTAQAVQDLKAAFDTLETRVSTTLPHATSFGSGETIPPGVYTLAGAVSIAGNLIMDGQNNPNSVFIFLVSGGAFTSGTASSITLINGASACNIAWVINGAISFAPSSSMKGTFISNNGAFSMASGSTLQGRGYSTTGALNVNAVSVAIPKECADFIATVWKGTTTDWNNEANWNNFIIPTSSTKLTIPANTNNIYPVLNTANDTVQSIVIKSGAALTLATGGFLHLTGDISNAGSLDATQGSIEFMGSLPQSIAAESFLNNTINNLKISNTLNFSGAQNITGSINFGNSFDTLYTNDNLVLKSSATLTAAVGDITNGGTLSGNAIMGNVSIERYISAKRAWRLLSTPIVQSSLTTINQSWQEAANSTDPNPGYGTQITGGSLANGFDQGVNGFSSIKIFDTLTNTLQNLPAAGTNIPIVNYPAYFLFVRGNRSTNLMQGTGAALSPTILRMKGRIFTGDTTLQINAANFTLVGNPYPSPVNFHTLTKVNVNDIMYVWDPKYAGSYGVGGYVTFSWNNGTASYDSTESVSAVSRYIQSGEAFFVKSTGTTGSLKFLEINKEIGGSDQVYRPMGIIKNGSVRVNLFNVTSDSSAYLSDGILTTYSDENTNRVDNNDALKMYNSAESMCIAREGKNIAIERRQTITGNDTSFLNIYKLKKQLYKFRIIAEGLNPVGLHAFLKDNYLGSLKNVPININGITEIFFNVNSDSSSFAINRFSILFNQEKIIVPPAFVNLTATKEQQDIKLEWTIQNELNLKAYQVETSKDGINFLEGQSILPKNNNGNNAAYIWTDFSVTNGLHYYRIKATNNFDKINYSEVVNINLSTNNNEKLIWVNSNSVNTAAVTLNIQNVNKGRYSINIFGMDGRLYNQVQIVHAGGNAIQNIILNNYMPAGKYELILSDKIKSYQTSFIKK